MKEKGRSGGSKKQTGYVRQVTNSDIVCSRGSWCNSEEGRCVAAAKEREKRIRRREKATSKGPARDVPSGLVLRPSPSFRYRLGRCLFYLFYHTPEKSGQLANFRSFCLENFGLSTNIYLRWKTRDDRFSYLNFIVLFLRERTKALSSAV